MKKIKRGDILLLLIIGFASIVILLLPWGIDLVKGTTQADNLLIAEIKREGKTVAEIDLNSIKDTQYITFDEGIKVTIEAKPGKIRFLDAQCPDRICVKTGWLTREGHIAVCLPSKTVVSVNLR